MTNPESGSSAEKDYANWTAVPQPEVSPVRHIPEERRARELKENDLRSLAQHMGVDNGQPDWEEQYEQRIHEITGLGPRSTAEPQQNEMAKNTQANPTKPDRDARLWTEADMQAQARSWGIDVSKENWQSIYDQKIHEATGLGSRSTNEADQLPEGPTDHLPEPAAKSDPTWQVISSGNKFEVLERLNQDGQTERLVRPLEGDQTEVAQNNQPELPGVLLQTAEVYTAEQLKDGVQQRLLADQPPPGKMFLYRGVKGHWGPPRFSTEQMEEFQNRVDQIVGDVLGRPDPSFAPGEKEEFDMLQSYLTTEGDQWFSDNLDVAANYSGNEGSLVRILIDIKDAQKYYKETGVVGGGKIGNNFRIPSELFRSK